MSCLISSLAFLFLVASIGAEALSFLTSYMVVNRLVSGAHDGIFQRCGAMDNFKTAVSAVSSYVSKITDGAINAPTFCVWWDSRMFEKDEKSMKAITVLALISAAILAITFILFLVSLIDRFKTKGLNIFLGVMMLFNGVILSAIIIVYTLLYAKDAKMNVNLMNTTLVFSWSYWVLYGAAAGNLFTAILFCCNPARSASY